ncbi:MAG: peroxiredoxin family protein [Prolixibacteraceae bacterium]
MKHRNSVLFFFLMLISSGIIAQDNYSQVKEGDVAPGFVIKTLDGETRLLSELKGKVVWLNFFATWCPPCRKELPHLQNVYNELKDNEDFEVFVIGREHDQKELQKFKEEQNFTMPFVPDPDRIIFSKYASQNIPRNIIIDKEGRVAVSDVGFNENDFNKITEKLKMLLK